MTLAPLTAYDAFTRSLTGSLGTANSGHVWRQASNGALTSDSRLSVSSAGYTRITMSSAVSKVAHYLETETGKTGTVFARVRFNNFSDTQFFGLSLRTSPGGYGCFTGGRISAVSSDGSMLLSIVSVGTDGVLYEQTKQARYDLTKGNWIWLKFRVTSDGYLRLRAWMDGTAEPTTWDINVAADTSITPSAAGYPGFFYGVGSTSSTITTDIETFYHEIGTATEPGLPVINEWTQASSPGLGWSESGHLWFGTFADDPDAYNKNKLGVVTPRIATIPATTAARYGFIGPTNVSNGYGYMIPQFLDDTSRVGIGLRGTPAYNDGVISASAGYTLYVGLGRARIVRESDDFIIRTYDFPEAITINRTFYLFFWANGDELRATISVPGSFTVNFGVTDATTASGQGYIYTDSTTSVWGSINLYSPLQFGSIEVPTPKVADQELIVPTPTTRTRVKADTTAITASTATLSKTGAIPRQAVVNVLVPSIDAVKPIKYGDDATAVTVNLMAARLTKVSVPPKTATIDVVTTATARLNVTNTLITGQLATPSFGFLTATPVLMTLDTITLSTTVKTVPAPTEAGLDFRPIDGVEATPQPSILNVTVSSINNITLKVLPPPSEIKLMFGSFIFEVPPALSFDFSIGYTTKLIATRIDPVMGVTVTDTIVGIIPSANETKSDVPILTMLKIVPATASSALNVERNYYLKIGLQQHSGMQATEPPRLIVIPIGRTAQPASVAITPPLRVLPRSATALVSHSTKLVSPFVWDTVVFRVVGVFDGFMQADAVFKLDKPLIKQVPPPFMSLSALSNFVPNPDTSDLLQTGLDLYVFQPNQLIQAEQITTNFERLAGTLGEESTIEVLRPRVLGVGAVPNGRMSALSDALSKESEEADPGYFHIGFGARQDRVNLQTIPLQINPGEINTAMLRVDGRGVTYYWVPKYKDNYDDLRSRAQFSIKNDYLFVSPRLDFFEINQIKTTSTNDAADSTDRDANPTWDSDIFTSTATGVFPVGSTVRTTDNNLWVRRQPGTDVDTHFDELPMGTRLLILDPPVYKNGYTWYRHRYQTSAGVTKEGYSAGEYMTLVSAGTGTTTTTTPAPSTESKKIEQARLTLKPLDTPFVMLDKTNFLDAQGRTLDVPWGNAHAVDVRVAVDYGTTPAVILLHGRGLSDLTGFTNSNERRVMQVYRETIPLGNLKELRLSVSSTVNSLHISVVGVWI